MMNSRLASILLAGACAALVGTSGCTSSSDPTPAHGRILSDLDGDGLFASAECDDPRPVIECGGPASDGHVEPGNDGDTAGTNTGCTVVPGPEGCVFLEVTGGGIIDPSNPDAPTISGSTGSGSTGSGSTGSGTIGSGPECYQCLDENMNPVGEPVCAPPNPISCEPSAPGPNGEDVTCWTCTDGVTTYDECYSPPTSCTTDADCAADETCVTKEPSCPPGAACPLILSAGFCVATGGGGGEPPPPPMPVPQPY